jgi:hypothetical protein
MNVAFKYESKCIVYWASPGSTPNNVTSLERIKKYIKYVSIIKTNHLALQINPTSKMPYT